MKKSHPEKGRETSTSGSHGNCTNILYYYSSKKKTREKRYGKKSEHAQNIFPYCFKNILYYNYSRKKRWKPKKGREPPTSGSACAHARKPPTYNVIPVKTHEKGRNPLHPLQLPVAHAHTQGNPFGVTTGDV